MDLECLLTHQPRNRCSSGLLMVSFTPVFVGMLTLNVGVINADAIKRKKYWMCMTVLRVEKKCGNTGGFKIEDGLLEGIVEAIHLGKGRSLLKCNIITKRLPHVRELTNLISDINNRQ